MTAEQKIVQNVSEAHALESALVQTLSAHIAVTPRSEYREILERHLAETRDHAARLRGRLSDLGDSRNPLELLYAIAQTAAGQVVAVGKLPLDLLRGTGDEDKLLKNAKDEAASEALEIVTYDALEALAEAGGDAETAALAREHRAQEERFLDELRGLIPRLARDAVEADEDGGDDADGSYRLAGASANPGAIAVGAAVEAARTVAAEVRESVEDAAGRVSRRPGDDAAPLPIADYDSLTVAQVLPKLRLLTQTNLVRVEAHERRGRARKQVLDRITYLRASTDGQPVGTD